MEYITLNPFWEEGVNSGDGQVAQREGKEWSLFCLGLGAEIKLWGNGRDECNCREVSFSKKCCGVVAHCPREVSCEWATHGERRQVFVDSLASMLLTAHSTSPRGGGEEQEEEEQQEQEQQQQQQQDVATRRATAERRNQITMTPSPSRRKVFRVKT
jgi:hypothetical protein